MGSHGSRTRRLVSISIYTKQSSEGGRAPGPRSLHVDVNGLEADLMVRRPRSWRAWKYWYVSFGGGVFLSTPVFVLDVGGSLDSLREQVGGDYSEEWWAERGWEY